MGSGGLVVLDDRDCMVEVARYFLAFTQLESCGQCSFCRIGTRRMLEILDRLCEGRGMVGDLEDLQSLAENCRRSSLCGLGRNAPNPVLSTLAHFREEYLAHLQGCCPAGKCSALISYQIQDSCIGCTKCAQSCPVQAITVTPYKRHSIDRDKCVKCDNCLQICPTQSIHIVSPPSRS